MGNLEMLVRGLLLSLLCAAAVRAITFEVANQAVDQAPGKCCVSCTAPKEMYFSIADDSGPWLCGQTCIRSSFYPIFHFFEKNLTKATNDNPCGNAGYTKYNS